MPLSNDHTYGRVHGGALAKAMKIPTYTVANAPAASANANRIIAVSNGAGGQPCLAYSNGTAWVRVVFGAAINATT
jgi:hypothetical protein